MLEFFKKLVQFISSIFASKKDVTVPTDEPTDETVKVDDSDNCADEQDADEVIESATEVVEMYQKTEEVEKDVEETTEDEKLNEDSPLSSSANSKYSNVVVFLDNGHTKSTPGKCSPDKSLYEWKYNREIVCEIENELDKLGIQHWNTHKEDGWVDSAHATDSKDLVLRVRRINSKYTEVKNKGKKAFMISVHVNAAGNGDWYNATGWCTYTTRGQNNSDKLADCLYDAAEEVLIPLGKKLRTDKSDGDRDQESDFYIIKKANCVCTLSENFFMDCKTDCQWLLSEEGRKAIVKLHIEGIKKYIERYC